MKAVHLVFLALAALCLTGCPDQDNNSSTSRGANQNKPRYSTPAGDSVMLLALAGAVIGAAEMLRRRK